MSKFLKFSIAVAILVLLPVFSLSVVHTPATFAAAGVRWASSSNTIYVTGPGAITLTDIDALVPQTAPLDLVDASNHIWYLGANLKLEQGATLLLHGTSIGGDVDQLRLKSNNSSAQFSTVWICAEWGTIDIAGTKVTSWDTNANGPDTEYSSYKRSYIYARSFLDPDGITARESRMDIVNSEICYLGYNGSEAYGLSWKVIGSSPGLYDKVNVLGNVTGSHIHHNYFGAYTYGAYGMEWRNNEIDYNVQYGFDGHDDSDNFIVEGNNSHHNGNHGIIFSQRCDHSIIRNNISRDNTGNGIMLHRNSNDSTVENNSTYGNSDSGIAIFDSHNNAIRNNSATGNGKGMRFSVGSSNNLIENNEINSNTSYGIYFYKGSDAPTSGDGRPKLNRFVGNRVNGNTSNSVKMGDADDNYFERNEISGKDILIQSAQRNRFSNNILLDTMSYKTTGSSTMATSTYLGGQALFNVAVDSYSSIILEDGSGKIFDPEESGIATTVTPAGSTLTLTKANIGTTSKVVTRNMLVTVTSGSTNVNPTIWEMTGNLKKEWTSQTNSSQSSNSYTVGDLAPGALYTVKKNGVNFLGPVPADSNGRINFTDTPGTTGTITYTMVLDTPGGPSPTIAFSPASLTFTGTQGGSNPAAQTLNISNSGGGTLNWTASSNATWLSLAPTSGTAPSTVTVTATITGLSAGTYNGTITITATGATNTPQTVPVTLTVQAPSSNWLTGWSYRKQITIAGSTAGAQTNYQMKLTINRSTGTDSGSTVYVGTKCASDYKDLRFTKNDGTTLLDYWLESSDSSTAIVWVELDSIPASPGTANFNLYYGNNVAVSSSNIQNTFVFGDDFGDGALDTTKWITGGGTGGSITEANGVLTVTAGSANQKYAASIVNYLNEYALHARAKLDSVTGCSSYRLVGFSKSKGSIDTTLFTTTFRWFYTDANFIALSGDGTSASYADMGVAVDTNYHISECRRYAVSGTNYDRFIMDGGPAVTGVKPSSTARYIYIQSNEPGKAVIVDWIFLRKFVSLEPAWGTWGSEETTG